MKRSEGTVSRTSHGWMLQLINVVLAKQLIKNHGNYNALFNNCQLFALVLFDMIADVDGSLQLTINAKIYKLEARIFKFLNE